MKDLLITSALCEITLAVYMGLLLVYYVLKGPAASKGFLFLHSKARILQAHIDYILMALLQLAIASVHTNLPTYAVYLLIFGSWGNPTTFLVYALTPQHTHKKLIQTVPSSFSLISLLIAYPWILYAWLSRPLCLGDQ